MNPLFDVLKNNPLMNSAGQVGQIYNLMKNCKNPIAMMSQMSASNPQIRQILQSLNSGENPEQVFRSECAKRGIDADQFLKNLQGK